MSARSKLFGHPVTLSPCHLVILLVGCNRPAAPPAGAAPPAEAATIETVSPKQRSLHRIVEQPGSVQAYEETRLFARVPGHVRLAHDAGGRIRFDAGREVRGPRWYRAG